MNEILSIGLNISIFFLIWALINFILKKNLPRAFKNKRQNWNYNFWLHNSEYGASYLCSIYFFKLLLTLTAISYSIIFIRFFQS